MGDLEGIIETDIKLFRSNVSEIIRINGEEDLYIFFRNNFSDLIKDKKIRDYTSKLMVEFVKPDKLSLFFDERHESVRLNDFWYEKDRRKAYKQFIEFGDSCLWLCGFLPAYLIENKSKLGLPYYISKGQESYNYAVYVGNEIEGKKHPALGTASRVSNNFKGLARSIFDLKNRVNASELIDLSPESIKEIRKVIYDGEKIPLYSERPLLKVIE